MSAVKINEAAAKELKRNLPDVEIFQQSILDFLPERKWDLAFTKGVLIHINPDYLPEVYKLMFDTANKYILMAEYYNPKPVEIEYIDHTNKLFKRDFASEMLSMFPKLRLLDYGFLYHGDPAFPQDVLTWFLLEKTC